MNTYIKALGIVGIALASISTFAATAAHAQDTTIPVQKPFRVKIGGYFPTSGDVKDAVGDSFLAGGLSYDFSKTTATNPAIYNVYLDYTDKSRTDSGVKSELGILGIGAAARFMLTSATNNVGRPYAEVGLGYYSIKAKASATVNGVTFSDSETKGRFGGKVAAGYELPVGLFGEVEYDMISKVNDYNPSGLRASVGYRF